MQPAPKNLDDLPTRPKAAVTVILHHPEKDDLANLSDLATWGVHVVVVINAIDPAFRDQLPADKAITIITNPANLGLARALNQGVGAAIDAGAQYVLMLDQDSRPTRDMLDRLLATALRIESEGRALACVAPLLRDRKAMDNGSGSLMVGDTSGTTTFATSGTMLTQRAWNDVGSMWEPLFIDGIDHEWCFRARARGFETVLVPDAVMNHDMGELAIKVGGRFRPLHRSPIRHYFIVRNTLWLAGRPYIPLSWRLRELAKLAYRAPSYVLFSSNKPRTIGNIAAAIADGIGGTNRRQPV